MDASRRRGDPPAPSDHPAAEGSLTFRLGKPINGHAHHGAANGATNGSTSGPKAETPTSEPSETDARPASTGPNDPRWVLAIRAREALRGRTIPKEQHRKLIRLGKLLGLSEAGVRHIVDAVQNQARSGLPPNALGLLAHLPPPALADDGRRAEQRRIVGHAAFWSLLVLLAELVIVFTVL
jgi:hypothetical protein